MAGAIREFGGKETAVIEKTELNSLEEIKLALEHRRFADIMAASVEIQSRLVVKVPAH